VIKIQISDIETILLDSSLISEYKKDFEPKKLYNLKVIDCGDYIQIYSFENSKLIRDREYEKEIPELTKIDTDNLYKKERVSKNELRSISLTNAIRSKLACQRLAKSNMDKWETFITLTFEDNITNISEANKIFHTWVCNVRKLKKDMMYVAVPEFQKRGAVHYHILSNLGIKDTNIILPQKEKKGNAKACNQLFDVKYWNKGFARVDFIKGDEDIDNRLFGKHRYMYSQNLNKPKTSYINMANERDRDFMATLLNNYEIDFEQQYEDIYTKTNITYYELKK